MLTLDQRILILQGNIISIEDGYDTIWKELGLFWAHIEASVYAQEGVLRVRNYDTLSEDRLHRRSNQYKVMMATAHKHILPPLRIIWQKRLFSVRSKSSIHKNYIMFWMIELPNNELDIQRNNIMHSYQQLIFKGIKNVINSKIKEITIYLNQPSIAKAPYITVNFNNLYINKWLSKGNGEVVIQIFLDQEYGSEYENYTNNIANLICDNEIDLGDGIAVTSLKQKSSQIHRDLKAQFPFASITCECYIYIMQELN